MTETVFEPSIKVTKQALARKEKFLKSKFYNGLPSTETYMSKPRKVYFDDLGNIVCITKDEDFDIPDDWKTAKFTVEELRMISGNKSYSAFKVVEESGKYCIKHVKSLNKQSSRMAGELTEVPWNTDDVQLNIKVEQDKITVYLSDQGADYLAEFKDNNYIVRGYTYFPVYVCAKNNPSFLIDRFDVSLKELATQNQMTVKTSDDYTQFSIYTLQLFDSYGRL